MVINSTIYTTSDFAEEKEHLIAFTVFLWFTAAYLGCVTRVCSPTIIHFIHKALYICKTKLLQDKQNIKLKIRK